MIVFIRQIYFFILFKKKFLRKKKPQELDFHFALKLSMEKEVKHFNEKNL